jgi:hypothetical protein
MVVRGTPRSMAATAEHPVDRLLIAACVDRLIFGSEQHFDVEDARTLLAALPYRRSPWFEFGVAGKMSGGSSQGFAAGVGSVQIKDDKDRQFSYSSASDAYTRAGQWKLLWIRGRRHQHVEIEQVMADATDEGRGARINYLRDGTPIDMDIRIVRSLRLLWSPVVIVTPSWRAWKTPP